MKVIDGSNYRTSKIKQGHRDFPAWSTHPILQLSCCPCPGLYWTYALLKTLKLCLPQGQCSIYSHFCQMKSQMLLLHMSLLPVQFLSIVFVEQMAKAGYHCYAPDWLGFGFSEKPQPDYDFSYTGTYYYFPTNEYSVALSLNICLLKLIAWLCGDRTLLG